MQTVCAWCRQPLTDAAEDVPLVSHGICDACLERALLDGSLTGSPVGAMRPPARDTAHSKRERAAGTAQG